MEVAQADALATDSNACMMKHSRMPSLLSLTRDSEVSHSGLTWIISQGELETSKCIAVSEGPKMRTDLSYSKSTPAAANNRVCIRAKSVQLLTRPREKTKIKQKTKTQYIPPEKTKECLDLASAASGQTLEHSRIWPTILRKLLQKKLVNT